MDKKRNQVNRVRGVVTSTIVHWVVEVGVLVVLGVGVGVGLC